MKREVALRFYDIAQCGYFPWGKGASAKFGDIQFLMKELLAWSAGQELSATRLAETANAMPVYLAGVRTGTNWSLVTLWNEVPSDDGKIGSIKADAKVGRATVIQNDIAAGSIPGFATYFLVMPKEQQVASVRIVGMVTGTERFKDYFEQFLTNSTSAVVATKDASGEVHLAYKDASGKVSKDLRPRFSLSLRRLGGQAAFIKKNAGSVRKIIRLRMLKLHQQPDKDLWQKLLGAIHLSGAQAPSKGTRLKYELNVDATAGQIKELVDTHVDEVEKDVDDLGFVFQGDTDIHWLSSAIARADLELDLTDTNGLFDSRVLIGALESARSKITAAAGAATT